MSEKAELPSVDDLIAAIVTQLKSKIRTDSILIGVHTGGVWVAEKLHESLGLHTTLGTLDITFYRDDFTRIGMQPEVKGSNLPEEMDNSDVILVDDVLHTGRTIRAALNEIFSFGRPSRVLLVVLIDRNGRELPIQADIVGATLSLKDKQHIKLTGPDDLSLTLTTKSS